MSQMLEDKRATRGLRMAELVGEAAEEDETFWKPYMATVEEGDENEDDSYEDEEEEKEVVDVFDSDFNDTEDEEDEGSENEEKRLKEKKTTSHNRYKEPVKLKSAPKISVDTIEIEKEKPLIDESIPALPRNIRPSTKAKTDENENKVSAIVKIKSPAEKRIRTTYQQKQLLHDALDTEIHNKKWLASQKLFDDERILAEKPIKTSKTESFIRIQSRRGALNTITFTHNESFPTILSGVMAPELPLKVINTVQYAAFRNSLTTFQNCVITGLPAKYRDPITFMPFATIDALNIIKKQFHHPMKTGMI